MLFFLHSDDLIKSKLEDLKNSEVFSELLSYTRESIFRGYDTFWTSLDNIDLLTNSLNIYNVQTGEKNLF